MGDNSKISWTDATWNPIIGCTRVSAGCMKCYAERYAFRMEKIGHKQYEGVTRKVGDEIRWTSRVNLAEHQLDLPKRWSKPRRIFVNSMSDLFHENVPDEWIIRIFETMFSASHHTYQILTKRPERMLAFMSKYVTSMHARSIPETGHENLHHIWLGVSVEDQRSAEERIPILLFTPAKVRWVSYEPALEGVIFGAHNRDMFHNWLLEGLNWVVVGGESGPGARPFDIKWARHTVVQCRYAQVPVFVKQLGAKPRIDGQSMYLTHRAGEDPEEWPVDLRIREFPSRTQSS